MKTLILALAVLVGGTAAAQQQRTEHKREHKTAEERATGLTEKMTAKLTLDDSQKSKIQAVNLGIAQKNESIHADTSLSREQKMAQLKENQNARNAQYKEILTSDQYAQYEAWEKEKQEKMQQKRTERTNSKEKSGKTTPTKRTEEKM
ncbi:hypothetical protein D3C87_407390 [compost metagenome]